MKDDRTSAGGTSAAFQKQMRVAGARYRLERLAEAGVLVAWSVTAFAFILLLLVLTTSLVMLASQVFLILLLLGLIGCGIIYSAAINRHRLLLRMDAHAQLPDAILSAAEWDDMARDPWRQRQRLVTLQALEKVDWSRAWPIRWPRRLVLPLACLLVLALAIGLLQRNSRLHTQQVEATFDQENLPVAAVRLKPLEQVFQDWDNAQKIAPSPEMEELLRQIKPMRDEMAAGKMTEKQVFLKLNEVQARLQASRDRLNSTSLDLPAESLAAAVQDLDGMSGLAAALQQKDFAAARDQAARAQEKYAAGTAKMPTGAAAQIASDRLGDAAQKAAQDTSAASALSRMQSAVSNQNSSDMGKGLDGLKESLNQQAKRQAQSRNLGLQLAQLGEAKDAMGQAKGTAPGSKEDMSQLSLAKSLEPGKTAGSTMDPDRFGAKTQLDSAPQEMKITGTSGDGAGETRTESTNDPHFEKTVDAMNSTQFATYEKLSEEATQDENLPVADRQMIKRYFQDIRPPANP